MTLYIMLIAKKSRRKFLQIVLATLVTIPVIAFQSSVFADNPDTKEKLIELYRANGYEAQQKGNYPEALSYYNKAITLGLENPVVLNDMGILYDQLNLNAKAEQYYLTAVRLDENYLPAYMNLAYFYQKVGEDQKALHYFKKRYELSDGEDPWAQIAKGEALKIEPEYRETLIKIEAKKLNEQIVKEAHESFYERVKFSDEHYQKGKRFLLDGQYDQALSEFHYALTVTPENPKMIEALSQAHLQWGQHYAQEGQFKEAIDEFNKALEFSPEDSQILRERKNNLLALAKRSIQQISDRAMKTLDMEDTVVAKTEIQEILETLREESVLSVEKMEEASLATEADQKLMEKRQRSEEHYHKGLMFVKDKEYQRAIGEFNRALVLIPNRLDAIEAIEQARLELLKISIQNHSDEALKMLDSGDTFSATTEIQKILATLPRPANITTAQLPFAEVEAEVTDIKQQAQKYYTKGLEFYKKKNYTQAIVEFERALTFTPENSMVIEMLRKAKLELIKQQIQEHSDQAIELLNTGDPHSAKNEIEKMLTTFPNEPMSNSK